MPPLSSEDARDQVRSRLNLVDVVQQHVRLRKQGRELWGLCPFHQEKTPSFHVNEQKQSWYCFSCQRGGDLFTFVELVEKTDFPGALRILAEQAGVELQERGAGSERAQLRRRLVELNRLAVQYYEYVLHSIEAGEAGRQLLARREVGEETARRFGLGYAPGGASFATFLRRRGHSVPDAIAAGLVRRSGQDFFQQRLVVPIRDERGQPLAFTGRTVLDGEPRKYVNTPETPAYVKGRVVFGLDLARTAVQERGHAVLMEGQFDVIVGHQFGVTNAIASSGTALTPDQLTLLRRFTEELVLVFDNDRAGRAAAGRATELAQDAQLRIRVARLEGDAKDPDEFLRGGGSWDGVLAAARPGWEVLVRDALDGLSPHRTGDREVGIRRVRDVLALIRDPAERSIYADLAGQLLEMEPGLLLALPATGAGRRPGAGPAPRGDPGPGAEPGRAADGRARDGLTQERRGNKLSNRVRYLLQMLAVRPEALERVLGILDPADLEEDDRAAYLRLCGAIERGGLDALGTELAEFPDEEQSLVREAWAVPPPDVRDEVIEDVANGIRRLARRRKARTIIDSLSEAERRRDSAQIEILQAQLTELRERN